MIYINLTIIAISDPIFLKSTINLLTVLDATRGQYGNAWFVLANHSIENSRSYMNRTHTLDFVNSRCTNLVFDIAACDSHYAL
jgi:hypothetical protein